MKVEDLSLKEAQHLKLTTRAIKETAELIEKRLDRVSDYPLQDIYDRFRDIKGMADGKIALLSHIEREAMER